MRALLAEPDSGVRSNLHAALSQRGWRVTEVPSGDAAISAFQADAFPLVVVSCRLSDVDGLAVCRAIRGTTLGRAAYILVTLPATAPEETEALVEACVDDFLTIPLLPSDLAMRLAFAEYRLVVHPGEEKRLRAQATELELVNTALHERTRELEAAMQARTRLYTSMNHELRTPISAIMLYQELLLAGALGELSTEQREALGNSHTAAEHLLELVRDILDLSKIEAGKMEVNPVEVQLPELVRDLLATVHPLTQRYGSEIRVEAPEELPRVVTDPQRVRQVLLNLVSNAARFGRARPITIRCRRLSESEMAVEVEDEGIGIGDADLQDIFEEFVQVGKIQEGGTGLGLAISQRLARLLDGRLEVESEPEVGSVFRLVLPSATASIRVPQE
jgi:signal transduction histidine kinase